MSTRPSGSGTPQAYATKGAATRRERSNTGTPKKLSRSDSIEIVPDSEEERIRAQEVIDLSISSDEGDEVKPAQRELCVPGAWPEDTSLKKDPITPSPAGTSKSLTKDIPSAGPELRNTTPGRLTPASNKPITRRKDVDTWRTPSPNKTTRRLDKHRAESDSEVEVLSGPVPGPAIRIRVKQTKPRARKVPSAHYDSEISESSSASSDSSDDPYAIRNKYEKYWVPPPPKVHSPKSLAKLRKLSPAAQDELASFNHRVRYAEQVYSYLNHVVFKNGLPPLGPKMQLKWTKKLKTTAGRASFHRDRYGNEAAEIQLAEKVVTSDGRIRNTLSHEMCHLASWVIDKEFEEAHGKIFMKWAQRVERKDPDIEISIRHTYEILYNYRWQCANCNAIVGRFTLSLDPEVERCRQCLGKLNPLFETPPNKKAKATLKKTSKHAAAAKSTGSGTKLSSVTSLAKVSIVAVDSSDEEEDVPSDHVQHHISLVPDYIYIESSDEEEVPSPHQQKEVIVVHDSDSELHTKPRDDITDLARKFEEGVTISHRVCLHAIEKH